QRAPVAAAIKGAFRDARSGAAATGTLEATIGVAESGVVEVTGLETDLAIAPPNRASRKVAATVAGIYHDPAAASVALHGVNATAAGAALTGDVAVTDVSSSPSVKARLALDAASLGDLLAAVDWPPPEGVSPAELGRVTASADVELDTEPQVVRVANVEA